MKKNYNKYLEKFIIKNGINLIINCVGQTYKNLDLYEYVYPNIILPLKILRWIEGKKILFIHFSSTEEILINSYLILIIWKKLNNRKVVRNYKKTSLEVSFILVAKFSISFFVLQKPVNNIPLFGHKIFR